jgi:ribonuclease P protein component
LTRVTAAVRSDGVASPRPHLWRVSDRATFQAFRAGRRVRRGPVSVTFVTPSPDAASSPPRVAFAVGKGAGGAVVRNRVRRRLRAAVRELQLQRPLPAGAYLLGGSAELAHLPWSALVAHVGAAIRAATEGAE